MRKSSTGDVKPVELANVVNFEQAAAPAAIETQATSRPTICGEATLPSRLHLRACASFSSESIGMMLGRVSSCSAVA